MAIVVFEISISPDGCITGPHQTADEPLGKGGEVQHEWILDDDPAGQELLKAASERHGAVPVLFGGGIRLFDHMSIDLTRLEPVQVVESRTATHLRYRRRQRTGQPHLAPHDGGKVPSRRRATLRLRCGHPALPTDLIPTLATAVPHPAISVTLAPVSTCSTDQW